MPFNQLSENYDSVFIQNLHDFEINAKNKSNKEYCAFYPSFGIRKGEKSDFLIFGQAVNSWYPQFELNEKNNYKKFLEESIEYSNSFYEKEDHCPIDWVNVYWSKSSYEKFTEKPERKDFYEPIEYYTFTSSFWNLTYKLICKYYDLDENCWDWAKKLVWSNLYKIAPLKSNPDENECSWQEEISIKLVRQEIEEIKPMYCIVMTNDSWWKPFRENLKTKTLNHQGDKEYIESVEKYNDSTIIVTKRSLTGSNNYITEILKITGKNI